MKKKISVVLKEKVEYLGDVGETKTVALGFLKNYLLPRGLVVPVGTKEGRELSEARRRAVQDVQNVESPQLEQAKRSNKAPKAADRTPKRPKPKPAKIRKKKK